MEDTFIFYPTFIQQIEAVQSNEVKARLYSAVAQYGCYGNVPDFSDIDPLGILDGLFVAIRYAIDETKSRRRAISETRRAAGMRGGAPKGNTNAQNKQKQPNTDKTSVNVNVNDNVNVDENIKEDREKRSARFSAPSLDEVKKFFLENGFTSDAEAFFDYYEANGWTQGNRKPLKKWEAAARQWERRQQEFSNHRPASKPTPPPKQTPTAPADEVTDFGGVIY